MLLLLLTGTASAQFQSGGTTARPSRGGHGGLPANSSFGGNPMGSQNHTANTNDTTENDFVQKGIEHHEEIPDSILLSSIFRFHYTPLAVKILHLDHPLLDPTGAQFSDQAEALNGNYYLGKGSVGQSCYPIFATIGDDFGPRLQPATNFPYSLSPQSIPLLQVQRPYTILGFGGSLKKDNHVHLTHSQNITQRWNATFNYHLIRTEGVFANSGNKNHYLDFSTNYYSRDSRYQIQGGILWQNESLMENGGITDDDYIRDHPNATQSGVPVTYTSGFSKSDRLTLFAHQSYNTTQQVYSLRERDSLAVNIVDSTKMDTIKCYDTIQPRTPKMVNTGVFGLDLQWDASTRKYIDSTRWNQLDITLFWTNDAYPDYIWHNPFKLTIGYSEKKILNFISNWEWLNYQGPVAQLEVVPLQGTLTAKAQMLQNYGQRFCASYSLPLDSTLSRNLEFSALQQSQEWDYLYRILNHTADSRPTTTTKLALSYLSPRLQADLIARHVDGNVWIQQGSSGLETCQAAEDAWLLQARLIARLQLGHFHYDMQQLLQYCNNSESLRVPLLASKNSLYADLTLFDNALRAQLGVDIRYHTTFYADAYDPNLGIFFRQNEVPIGNYFMGDIFINLQVKRATIYAKAGHVNSLIEQHPNYFLLPHYPASRLGLFFGVNWKFFD